jgi:pyruvate/2-oxoglutarate dehydrogenase complex dihydrolipoamide acyltransferase (E2) component
MPREVIMPALGMAQTTGLIVAWLKKPGEAVKKGDALMEVETDKAVMEVEAQADGFLTDVRVAAGDAAPVGDVVALISDSPAGSGAAPAPRPADAARAQSDAPVPAAQAELRPTPAERRAPKLAAEPEADAIGRRILASPKARRLAAEQGLDLSRLVAAGAPQPFHVSDLETLRALPAALAVSAPQTAQASRHLTARVRGDAFQGFCEWMRAETGASPDATSVMAGMAAAALRRGASHEPLIVAAEAFGQRRLYADPDRLGLGRAKTAEPGQAPALILRDLRGTGVAALRMGAEAAPALSVTRDGPDMLVTLECAPGQLQPEAAVDLISEFAGQLAEPLRHLL